MKKLLIILSMLFGIAEAQQITYTPMAAGGYRFKYSIHDSLLTVPFGDTAIKRGSSRPGAIMCFSGDSLIYRWDGLMWNKLGDITVSGDGIDSLTWYGNTICAYRAGVASCFQLDKFFDHMEVNWDKKWWLLYNNSILIDSARRYLTPIFEGAGINFIDTTTVEGDQGYIIEATGLSGSVVPDWSVIDSLNAPITSPVPFEGSIFLVGTLPTGAFATHANQIGTYDSVANTYSFQTATAGDLLNNAKTGFVSQLIAGNWVRIGRLNIHQAGDSYATDIVIGSNDPYKLQFRVNGDTAMYIDNLDKYLKVLPEAGILMQRNPTTGLSGLVAFGDGYTNISHDNTGMVLSQYAGRFRFYSQYLGSPTEQIRISEIGNSLLLPTSIGTLAGAHQGSILDLYSTTKGFLPPRMTAAQRVLIGGDIATATLAGGSGYTNGVYPGHSLTGGAGTGQTVTITVAGGVVTSVTTDISGTGYLVNDVLTASGIGAGTGFTWTVTSLGTKGMVVYDTDSLCLFTFNGTVWVSLCGTGGGGGSETWQQTLINGSQLTQINTVDLNNFPLTFSSGGNYLEVDPPNGILSMNTNMGKSVFISDDDDISRIRYDDDTKIELGNGSSQIIYTADKHLFPFGSYNALSIDIPNDTIALRVVSPDGSLSLIRLGNEGSDNGFIDMYATDVTNGTTTNFNIQGGGYQSSSFDVPGDRQVSTQFLTSGINNSVGKTSTGEIASYGVNIEEPGSHPTVNLDVQNPVSGNNSSITVKDTAINISTPLLRINGVLYSGGGGGITSADYIVREAPAGTINGSNVTFTLANTPIAGKEMVFLNGLLQDSTDYSISGAVITYTVAPSTGDKLVVTYIK